VCVIQNYVTFHWGYSIRLVSHRAHRLSLNSLVGVPLSALVLYDKRAYRIYQQSGSDEVRLCVIQSVPGGMCRNSGESAV